LHVHLFCLFVCSQYINVCNDFFVRGGAARAGL
jgi:hypothetical protein